MCIKASRTIECIGPREIAMTSGSRRVNLTKTQGVDLKMLRALPGAVVEVAAAMAAMAAAVDAAVEPAADDAAKPAGEEVEEAGNRA